MRDASGPARPFVVSYTGRVGSSALVDMLAAEPDIEVPIFEHLDRRNMEAQPELARHDAGTIHHAADYIFTRHRGAGRSVGFKWRIWGEADRLAEVFRRHDAVVISLMRSELLEQVASFYLSEHVLEDGNEAQFEAMRAASAAERQAMIARRLGARAEAEAGAFVALARRTVMDEARRVRLLLALRRRGCEIVSLFYEDFAYKRHATMAALARELGLPERTGYPGGTMTKVSSPFPSQQLENRDALVAHPAFLRLLACWRRLAYGAPFRRLEV